MNKQNKMRTLYIIILTALVFPLNAQKNYKDIIQLVNKHEYSQSYMLLMDYQSSNPEFANTYYQLGNIFYYWAVNSIPMENIEQTDYYIRNAKLFYGLCISKLNTQDRDVQKNRDFYKTIEPIKSIEKPKNEDVISFLDNQINVLKKYEQNAKLLYTYFNKFLNFYISSTDTYKEIISKYANLNDLFLEQKSLVFKSTNKLMKNFDSTLYYYKLYKDALEKTPEIDYNPLLKKVPIAIYRLDGLVRSDFTADTIYVWDYKTWANDVQNYLSNQITDFRETIIASNKKYNQLEYDLKNYSGFKHTFEPLVLEQNVYFKIEKFDFNSIISRLFSYRVAKINLLQYNLRIFNDTSNTSILPQSRYIEFYKLSIYYHTADSLLKDIESNNTEKNYKKHQDFIDFNYKGKEGLSQYIIEEKKYNKELIKKSIQNLLYTTYKDKMFVSLANHNLQYKNKTINNKISNKTVYNAPVGNYYTLAVSQAKSGERYFTGFYKSSAGSVSFIGKIVNGQIEWLKPSSSSFKSNESGVLIQAIDDGCVVVLHSYMNGKHYNNVVKMNSAGKQVATSEIKLPLMPRILNYDEINNTATIAMHGFCYNYQQNTSDSLTVVQLNMSTKTLDWQKEMKLNGKIISLIKFENKYSLIANFGNLNIDGKNYTNKKSNILNIIFSNKGEFLQANEIEAKLPNYGFDLFKINSQTISMIGFRKNVDIKNIKYNLLPEPYLIIFDKKNKIIFDSSKY